MKKTGLLLSCLILSLAAHSQIWLEAGGKMMFGLNGLYNENIINDPEHDFNLNTAISAGITLGINVGGRHGLNIEGILTSNQQEMTFQDDRFPMPTRNEIQWKSLDLYLLYRYYARTGPYLEAGAKYTGAREIKQQFGTNQLDVTGMYYDNYTSAVLGFGSLLTGSDVITLKFGIRGEYALNTFTTPNGDLFNFPAPYTSYETDVATRPFRATISLELSFALGEIGKDFCGRRGFMLQ